MNAVPPGSVLGGGGDIHLHTKTQTTTPSNKQTLRNEAQIGPEELFGNVHILPHPLPHPRRQLRPRRRGRRRCGFVGVWLLGRGWA